MGGKQSSISEEDLEKVESNHPQFKKIRLINNQDGKTLQVEFAINSPKDLAEWGKSQSDLKNNECLFLPIDYEIERKYVCGEGGICKVNYPCYQYLLSDYIAKFNSQDKLYENEKIWYLTYQLCETAHIFHTGGVKIGDVRPQNIFLNNFERVKVGNRYSWPHECTNYEKSIFDKGVTYLAPEEIKELSFGHNEPETNFELAESFSIGLTLLDRAILTDSTDLYSMSLCRLQYQKLEERLAKLCLLKQVIEGLCKPDFNQRLTCRAIYNWLREYREEIANKNELHFRQIPAFLNNDPSKSGRETKEVIPIPRNHIVESQVVSEFPNKFARVEDNHSNFYETKYQQVGIQNTFGAPLHPVQAMSHPVQTMSRPQASPLDSLSAEQMLMNTDDFALTLKKIQEQLQRSRKLFPS